ncbi:hypothetical protein BG842_13765 [Haladaptatus sp. W1]|uniref:hypothetical protein n=1 Tax=Haladaptatus sp. W1 TaxID=1897478 RepID=UPI0008497465|nr:hypothetical protein [Haladaptatus sp. W1]ODR80817.1 hypothetical protein BG842_13765 [Haladaptatus sp. W1]
MPDIERGASYFGVQDPEHAATDLERLYEEGLTAVLHTFSERDQAFYRETMRDIVAASHDQSLSVYVNPWAVGGVFGGEEFSRFVAHNPDSRQVLNTGERVPAACFNDPTFREFMREWTRDAAGLDADVLFWDEPHWHDVHWYGDDHPRDVWCCRCEHCRDGFREEYGEPMPATETEAVSSFREESMLDFLDEMMALAHEEGAENAVCLMPTGSADHGPRNWARLAENEHIDVLATDPYWDAFAEDADPAEFVSRFGEELVELADENDLRSQLWIQGFGLSGDSATEEVRTATRTVLDLGADSVFMWGYDGCRTISEIACEDPMGVWNAYLDEVN